MRGPATTQCRRLRYSNEGWNSYARLLVEGETRSEEHTSELQSLRHLVCRLLLEKKKKNSNRKLKRMTDAELRSDNLKKYKRILIEFHVKVAKCRVLIVWIPFESICVNCY